jgi:hypothetical protein
MTEGLSDVSEALKIKARSAFHAVPWFEIYRFLGMLILGVVIVANMRLTPLGGAMFIWGWLVTVDSFYRAVVATKVVYNIPVEEELEDEHDEEATS